VAVRELAQDARTGAKQVDSRANKYRRCYDYATTPPRPCALDGILCDAANGSGCGTKIVFYYNTRAICRHAGGIRLSELAPRL